MNKTLVKRVSIAAFILLVLALIIIPKLKPKEEISGAPAARGGIVPVTIKIIRPEDFTNKLQVSGSVFGNEEVQLRTETSGKVISIGFTEGARVNKGDLLVKVNDADLQAQLRKAEIKKKDAQEKEYRQKILLSKNGISKETYETAVNDLDASIADIENITVVPDSIAKVVISERTGTIVMGENVKISEVAVSYGGINVTVGPVNLYSEGHADAYNSASDTMRIQTNVNLSRSDSSILLVPSSSRLSTLVKALNAIKAKPQELIAILQAMKKVGSLKAELEII